MQEELNKIKETVEKHGDTLTALKTSVYGDKALGVKGMNEKVDEIHTILVQAKGIRGFFGLTILIGALIVVLQSWMKGHP